jgi:hypothetical protein
MANYQLVNVALLLLHALVSVALLGAVSHQCVAVLRARGAARVAGGSFVRRYASVGAGGFVEAVGLLYLTNLVLGAILYPEYRIESRYALEEMRLLTVVGLFELKEHWAALGVAVLPLYVCAWRSDTMRSHRRSSTLTLGFIVWFTSIVGHVVNNFRGV